MGRDMDEEVKYTGAKSGTIAILRVLEDYSGKGFALSQKDIISKVRQDYGFVIDRKTVGRTIDLLEKFKTSNRQRIFNIDRVTEGVYLRNNSNSEIKIKLRSAITNGKRVSFILYARDIDGKEVVNDKKDHPQGLFVVDPYEIVNSMGHEYLVCHWEKEKTNTLRNLRLDRMHDVILLNDNRIPLREMKGYSSKSYINKKEYEQKMSYHMFGGEIGLTQFRIDAGPEEDMERKINVIWGELGHFENFEMRKMRDGWIKVSARMPKMGARAFAFQFAEMCTLIWPDDLVNDLNAAFEKIRLRYAGVTEEASKGKSVW